MPAAAFIRHFFILLTLTSLLLACGGGGGGADPSTPSVNSRVITGIASKGTLRNALVTAYQITADGQKGAKLTDTQTDNNGAYTLKITDYVGAVLLEVSGDGNTTMLCDIPSGCENGKAFGAEVPANFVMQSVLPELLAANQVAITPFTHLATQYAQKDGLSKANIDKAFTQIQDLFGLPNLQSTVPVAITGNVSDDLDNQRYAILNAAIGKLAGRVDKISGLLNSIASELNAKNGQLQSSEAGVTNTKIDLADILKAAIAVANDSHLNNKIHAITKAALAADLAHAQLSQALTEAKPSDNAGATDLAKAKAFMKTTGNLVTTLQQYDDQSLSNSLKSKTNSIRALTDGDVLIADALHSTIVLLLQSALDSTVSRSYNYAETQQLLDKFVNTPTLYVMANSDVKIMVDVASHTVNLNGVLTIQPKLQTGTNSYINDGAPQYFNVINVLASYPEINTPASSFTFKINNTSKIRTPDLELGFSDTSDSVFTLDFTQLATLKDQINAFDADDLSPEHVPAKIQANINQVTLLARKAPTNEINKFVGSLQLTMAEHELDIINSSAKRKWPTPELINLMGKFTSPTGDLLEANTTVTFDKNTQALISPGKGHVRPDLYSYQYNDSEHAIYLTANAGLFNNYYWNQDTKLKIVLSDKFCGLNNYYLVANGSIYLSCTDKTNVVDAYQQAITSAPYSDWFMNTYIKQEGTYRPQYPNNFNYATSNATAVNGVLDWADNALYENSTHFTPAALSMTTRIKLLGTSASDIDAQISAKRTTIDNGEYMANFRIGNDKIILKSLNVDNKPDITLINKDNIGIDLNILEKEKFVDITLNGKVLGHIYKLGGLPIAKFIDNSIIGL